jgi:AcrR family transcriptional regulator
MAKRRDSIKGYTTKNNTKDAILNSAKELFLEKGYDGASIDDISKHAKITKSLVYYYFESKEDILYAIMKNSVENTISKLAEKRKVKPEPETTDELFNDAVALIESEGDVLKIAIGEIFKRSGKTDLICDLPMAIFDEYKEVYNFTNREKVLFILFAIKILAFNSLKDRLQETLFMTEEEIETIFRSNIEPIFNELTKKGE